MVEQLSLELADVDHAAARRCGELWAAVLAEAETRLGREAVDGWLRDAVPVGMGEGHFAVAVPNGTARAWIERKYSSLLGDLLTAHAGEALSLAVTVRPPQRRAAKGEQRGTRGEAGPTPRPPRAAPVPAGFEPLPLNERFSFERYVVGKSNRFAHAAAGAVAGRPGKAYNPLFLYGGVGLGKTHLLQAVGNALLTRNPRARVAYVSGETFTSHFLTSLRERRQEDFRRAYRGVELWLVDDVQFIADKSSTREEFFHTFNELYLTNRPIVLAADRPPRELRLLDDRLRSRLESGLMAEIGPPDLETRVAILWQRAEREGVELPQEVLLALAGAVSGSVRLLEAALVRLLALASLQGCAITPELAARAAAAFVREGTAARVGMAAIQLAVCEQFRLAPEDLTGARRDRVLTLARQVAMYLAREIDRASLAEIGLAFGGKTHSTVHYSLARLSRQMQEDEALAGVVRELRARIEGAER